MKILLYGSNGWIGSLYLQYMNTNHPNIEIIIGNSRIDNDKELEKEIINNFPTHIISFTGRTHGVYDGVKINTIDYLEKPGKLFDNIRDNLYGPINIATICDKYNIHFTYIGTGCIFNFDDDHPYEQEINGFTENDLPNYFGSSYSIVKGFSDRIMKKYNNVLNLRIRMPITSDINNRNFIYKIVNYQKICSIKNSMTVLPEFFPIIYKMMNNKLSTTVNLVNPGLISHNEILEIYKEIVDPDFTWNNFSIEEQAKILLSARSNNYLDTTFLENNYPEILNIKDSVRNILIQYKNNVDKIKDNFLS